MFVCDERPYKVVILDTNSFKIKRTIAQNHLYCGDVFVGGWAGNNQIWYFNSEGIFLFDLEGSTREKIVNKGVVLAWSKGGRYLTYSRQTTEAVTLYLFDCRLKESKVLRTESSGYFGNALIDNARKKVYYSLVFNKDNSGQIGFANINDLNWKVVWSRDSLQSEPVDVDLMVFTAGNDGLLFSSTLGTYNDVDDGIFLLNLPDGRIERVVKTWDTLTWDYSPKTNKIIWCDPDLEKLKEKEVKVQE